MSFVIDFKNLVDNIKIALETVVSPVIPFNLADVKNKDYLFILDSYKIIKQDKNKNECLVEVLGKVLKPCNLQDSNMQSGYFHFGFLEGDIKTELVTLNFNDNVEILGDFTKISYGFGAMQVVNFKGFATCNFLNDDGTAGGADEEIKKVIGEIIDTEESIKLPEEDIWVELK